MSAQFNFYFYHISIVPCYNQGTTPEGVMRLGSQHGGILITGVSLTIYMQLGVLIGRDKMLTHSKFELMVIYKGKQFCVYTFSVLSVRNLLM